MAQQYGQIANRVSNYIIIAGATAGAVILLCKIIEVLVEFFWSIIPYYQIDTTLDELNDLLDNQAGMP